MTTRGAGSRPQGAGRRRQGQAYTEFVIILPLLLLLIAGIIAFGQAIYVKLATEAAAWAAARHAAASLNPDRGPAQAFTASRYALQGFGLNPDSAHVQVAAWGGWGRGRQIAVQVCYDVPPPPVPYGEYLLPSRICSRQTMAIYRWKSRW